jgi:transposase InsO family protein
MQNDASVGSATTHRNVVICSGLTRLGLMTRRVAVIGMTIQRIRPGHRQQNGPHERMHLLLK